jgi:hypothetical protein
MFDRQAESGEEEAYWKNAAALLAQKKHPLRPQETLKDGQVLSMQRYMAQGMSGELDVSGLAGKELFISLAEGIVAPKRPVVLPHARESISPRPYSPRVGQRKKVEGPKYQKQRERMIAEHDTTVARNKERGGIHRDNVKCTGAVLEFYKEWARFTENYKLTYTDIAVAWSAAERVNEPYKVGAIAGSMNRLMNTGSVGSLFLYVAEHPNTFFDTCEAMLKMRPDWDAERCMIPDEERQAIVDRLHPALLQYHDAMVAKRRVNKSLAETVEQVNEAGTGRLLR